MPVRERVRWRIAVILDHLIPWACWADLAIWAMHPDEHVLYQACQRSWVCEQDRQTNGCCWCGKYRGEQPKTDSHV
jgi:hypothetical protein